MGENPQNNIVSKDTIFVLKNSGVWMLKVSY